MKVYQYPTLGQYTDQRDGRSHEIPVLHLHGADEEPGSAGLFIATVPDEKADEAAKWIRLANKWAKRIHNSGELPPRPF